MHAVSGFPCMMRAWQAFLARVRSACMHCNAHLVKGLYERSRLGFAHRAVVHAQGDDRPQPALRVNILSCGAPAKDLRPQRRHRLLLRCAGPGQAFPPRCCERFPSFARADGCKVDAEVSFIVGQKLSKL